jgi:[acyl-carrier-protein] S-malonyltransferase
MIAFVFPGQGTQKVGMGQALAERFPICRQTFEEADAALGEPLSALCFGGPEDRLLLTENTQPAILAVSVAACRLVESQGVRAVFAAGHSVGEYSAHVAAGTLSFQDALTTVRRRGRYMQEAVPVGTGAMSAILGLEAEGVATACQEAAQSLPGQVVSPANLNAPGQVVIAGSGRSCRRAREGAGCEAGDSTRGERAVPLCADEAG